MSTTTAATPHITSQSFTLTLPDPSWPTFVVQLVVMRGSIMLFVGTSAPFAISHDFACAVPNVRGGAATSTAISKSTSSSLSMSAKFSQRYKTQIFLSLDLSAFATQGGTADRVLLSLEKGLIMKLDPILKKA